MGIAPGFGGALTHFRWKVGETMVDWLRPATHEDLAANSADRLASFPLVPFSNRIRDGRFTFEGETIRLSLNRPPLRHAIHGHGWQAAWYVVEARSDRIALAYEHPAGAWPFPYRARQEITLDERELVMTLSIENLGARAMPAGLGWHPYFPRTPRTSLRALAAAMWATDADLLPTELVAADARLASAEGIPIAAVPLDNVFTGWRREAVITWPEWNARLAIVAKAPIDFLVVYSPPGKDFFCVEPVSHCTDAFHLAALGRTDTGMRVLDPGAQLRTSVRLRPTRLRRPSVAHSRPHLR